MLPALPFVVEEAVVEALAFVAEEAVVETLAFVAEDLVVEAFEELADTLPGEADDVVHNFEDTYIGRPWNRRPQLAPKICIITLEYACRT